MQPCLGRPSFSPVSKYLANPSYRLGDRDDDVRSVAASCLLPVAGHLVAQLPEELSRVLAVLWSCLRDMRDDLSSSVGAVMELLGREIYTCGHFSINPDPLTGKLVKYDEVIAILGNRAESYVLTTFDTDPTDITSGSRYQPCHPPCSPSSVTPFLV